MDCCNYVEAYAAGSHFYQQQHYFCYDNMNTDYGGYEPPPISNAIETSARYNGTVTPAYPIDYVYNPKEARLRKAMREQSRELSRRSILQSAIARASVIAGPVTSGGFLDHQHRFGCVSSANIPMNSSMEPVRVAEPWFQSTPRPKPIHSPRMTDWYGNVADPIERLQVMGAMHQRGLDKCKDVMRNQAVASVANTVSAECGATFSNNGYPVDFSDVNRERELRRQENMEYNEFTDGQKWHPYQNGGSAHQHPRTSHPPQMSNILHPNIQNPGPHGHGPWGQFCHNVLPHASSMPRNIGVRGPRHTVLLRDRVPVRHCEFPEETARMMYNPSKLDIENVRASYTPPEHQMPRMLETSVNSVMDSASTMRIRREDDGPRWEPNAINNRMSMDNLAATTESSISCEKERESRRSVERFEPKKKTVSKQPLPGFHQAFGSTEIGRFSRSEFFVNMVGESGASVEVADTESTNLLPKTYLSTPVIFPFSSRSCGIMGTSAAIHRITESGEILSRITPEECCWFATQSRCGVSRISDNVVENDVENSSGQFKIIPFTETPYVKYYEFNNCTAYLDCSHHARDKEWYCQTNTMNTHPSKVHRQRENYESFMSERGDGSYIIIGTPSNGNRSNNGRAGDDDFDNDTRKQTAVKMENNDSPKHTSFPSGKKDGNI